MKHKCSITSASQFY